LAPQGEVKVLLHCSYVDCEFFIPNVFFREQCGFSNFPSIHFDFNKKIFFLKKKKKKEKRKKRKRKKKKEKGILGQVLKPFE